MVVFLNDIIDGDAQNILGVKIGVRGHAKKVGGNKTLCGQNYDKEGGIRTFKQRHELETHLDCLACGKEISSSAY